MAHPPKDLQATLWSSDVDQLDLEKHKPYIIHQILTFGTMDQLKWLFDTYAKREIVDTFVHHPMKMYTKQTFLFIKNFILELQGVSIDESQYVAYTWQRFPGKFGLPPKRIWSSD